MAGSLIRSTSAMQGARAALFPRVFQPSLGPEPINPPAAQADTAPSEEQLMPVFNAHVPANRFSSEQKRVLADALNQSLVQALGIPEGDRFIMISEHGENELFLDPTFMG
ncbi:tautomerase family protein, partial [Streptomyces spiralis]